VAETPEKGMSMRRSLPRGLRSVVFFSLLAALATETRAQSPSDAKPTAPGQVVYERWCAPCHAPGPGHPGTQSLQLKYGGKAPAVLLERTDLSAQAVAVFVRQGVLMMAPFRKTEITDAELAALTAFVTRNYKTP
jgi:mono/diheme cytochrome c family protein